MEYDQARPLLEIMREAAKVHVLPRFRSLAPEEISQKSDHSDLVTLADTEAEAAMTASIRALWPEAHVIGEEAVSADKSLLDGIAGAERAVILDPVDGTWNFAKGLALFGMILAVTEHGRPIYGAIYDPVLDDVVEAVPGQPTRMVGPDGAARELAASGEAEFSRMTGYLPIGLFRRADRERLLTCHLDFARITTLRCSAHEYRMLAQGHAHFLLSGPAPNSWDHAAGALAVQQAGGVVRFLDGEDYRADRNRGVVLAAGSPALWDRLAERFAFLA